MTPIAESHVPVQEYIAFPANADLLTAPAKSKNLLYGILNLPARILAPDEQITFPPIMRAQAIDIERVFYGLEIA
ncbi:unnamed protein product [Dibothriocephalus latus]|uniref:Uncharacterized protein n=1 Tax=Dibothriocephalus latus TaxID=60516 RepID=A0A3P7P0F8_DIBLA|nr:unnamed protein product [Dibothriocephalus latus]